MCLAKKVTRSGSKVVGLNGTTNGWRLQALYGQQTLTRTFLSSNTTNEPLNFFLRGGVFRKLLTMRTMLPRKIRLSSTVRFNPALG